MSYPSRTLLAHHVRVPGDHFNGAICKAINSLEIEFLIEITHGSLRGSLSDYSFFIYVRYRQFSGTRTRKCLHPHTHTQTHTDCTECHIYMGRYTQRRVHTDAQTPIQCTRERITYINTHTHPHILSHAQMQSDARTHTHTHTHVHAHTHMHTHTHFTHLLNKNPIT